MELTTWHIEINGGKEQTLETKTSLYELAAIAALAMLDYESHKDYDVVKIWVPRHLPDYGPYFYAYNGTLSLIGVPENSRKW